MLIQHNHKLCSQSENMTLSIVAEGNAFCDTNWHARNLTPPYTRLYYIIDGAAEIETEQGILCLTAGKLYLLPAGYSFSHRCDSSMHQLYFHVNLFNAYGTDVLRGIHKVLCKEVSPLHLNTLLSLFGQDNTISRGYLKSILQADIFALLTEYQINIKSEQYSEMVRKALVFIDANLSMSLTVKKISDEICVSPTTLSHGFKTELGVPIGKYIDGLVMYRAENLLISTGLPLSHISDALGFCDQFYFSRRFKEKYKIPPLEYRKLHRFH